MRSTLAASQVLAAVAGTQPATRHASLEVTLAVEDAAAAGIEVRLVVVPYARGELARIERAWRGR